MPKRSTARTVIIPPPVLGLNTTDPISEMDPRYAVLAVNCFSNGATVDSVAGGSFYSESDPLLNDEVTCLGELALQSGVRKVIGVAVDGANDTVWDFSAATAVDISGGVNVGSQCNFVNFRNKIFMRSTDVTRDVYYWDGAAASITAAGFTGPSSDDKALTNVSVYKNRLYFTGNDGSVWYGGIDAITGALTQFDVSSVLKLGGKLLYAGGVQKAGQLNQNLFAFISDRGEVLLYDGAYPGASEWQQVGQYFMPPPAGFRSFFNWGANLVVVTIQGLVLLSEVLSGDGSNLTFLSEKINNLFVELIDTSYADLVHGVFHPQGNLVLVHFRPVGSSSRIGLAMNTITGSWWKWEGVGNCVATWDGNLVAGGADTVTFAKLLQAASTSPPTMAVQTAFNYFGDRSLTKNFVEAQPIMYQSHGMQLAMEAVVDFGAVPTLQTVTPDNSDNTYKVYSPKVGLKGIGNCASMYIRSSGSVTVAKRFSLQAIKVLFLEGDI